MFSNPLTWNAEIAKDFHGGRERMQQLARWAISLFKDSVMSWALTANAAMTNEMKQNHPPDQMLFRKGTKKAGLC